MFQAIILRKLTLFRMGFFGVSLGWCWPKRLPLPKICHTYPKMMKLGTVIPYLKKIRKIMIHVTLMSSADISNFPTEINNFCYIKNICIDCILIQNFYFFNFSWVFKDCFNLMMSAKMVTPDLLKIKVFWNKVMTS